jgi:RHS repeat-associated protein
MNFRNSMTRALVTLMAVLVGAQALAARKTTYFHNDGLGSLVAATNDSGQVLWRKDYAPFGEQIDTTPDNERTSYTGKQHDDVTGLTYFGGRNYDPELGRFVSVDPVGFVEDNAMSFNRYLYVNNNPYKYVDPDGEFLNFAAKFVLDVAIGVAINYVTTGKLDIKGAVIDSAIGILNPAKTLMKAKKLASALAKVNKVAPCPIACFAAGTAILTDHGYQPIELVEVGTQVWAHDPETGETSLKPVLATFVNTRDTVWNLVIEKDGLLAAHTVTGSHPYLVLGEDGGGTWQHVDELQVGATFSTLDGGVARLISIEDTGQVMTTYNFEVADINTYYVSSAQVLVHNCKGKGAANILARVDLRKETREAIEAAQPRNRAGKMIDPNTGKQLKTGEIDIGHKKGKEWWRRKAMHEKRGSTRKEVIEAENNPKLYQLENRSSNRSRKHEKK